MVQYGTAVPEHVKIAYRGEEVQCRPFSAGTSFTPRPHYPQKTTPIPNGGCVIPRAGLDVLENRKNVLTLPLVIQTIL
jgi:hypothetical protein